MTLIVDNDKYAELGIEAFFFPGGEPHVRLPKSIADSNDSCMLFLKLRTWNDVGLALALQDAFMCAPCPAPIFEFIPYLPGARQDRTDGYTPVTAELLSRLLRYNSETVCFDPHSNHVLSNGIHRENIFMPRDLLIPIRRDVVGIISPDKGATIRAHQFRDRFYPNANVIVCDKKRDFATGKFAGYSMPELIRTGRYIIVDDICDGGGTFNLLADAFFNDPYGNLSKLELFVSHGIFSKGLDAIDKRIESITTTNSWCKLPSDSRLTVLQLEQLFPKILGVLE